MDEYIFNLLATKFQGAGDDFLKGIAERTAKTIKTEDEANKYVEDLSLQMLIKSYGDQRANNAAKTAVANYEAKHKLKNGMPATRPDGEGTDPEPAHNNNQGQKQDTPDWAKAILEANKQLQERLNAIEKAKAAADRSKQIQELLEGAPNSVRKLIERIPVDNLTDADFNALLKDIAPTTKDIRDDYNEFHSRNSYRPYKSAGEQFVEAEDEEVDKLFNEVKPI